MNVWELCTGTEFIKNLSVDPYRVVEAQHISSSRDLVDSAQEHDILEDLIEESKPLIKKEKNYLIFTPFRYPPLKYGSRFGRLFEPSLWYGSLELKTAFTEVAYCRLKFLEDTTADLGSIEITMTSFKASLATQKGIDLTEKPFTNYAKELSNKEEYTDSQLLGTHMRAAHIEAFIYFSARTHEMKKNIGAFTPDVFQLKKNQYVHNQQTWSCFANKQYIEFTRIEFLNKEQFRFSSEYFN